MDEQNYGRRKDDIMLPDLNNEIASNLTESQKINVKFMQNLTSLNTALNDVQHDVAIHQRLLITGNGERPIPERIRNLEAFQTSIQFWFRTIAVALVLQTLTFGTAAIVWFIKLSPFLDKLNKLP